MALPRRSRVGVQVTRLEESAVGIGEWRCEKTIKFRESARYFRAGERFGRLRIERLR